MQQSTPQLLAWVKETQTGAYLALQDLVSGLSIRCEKLNKNSSLHSVCKYYKQLAMQRSCGSGYYSV